MFPSDRQAKLNPILKALSDLNIGSVQQDDFDSVGINVFIYLDSAKLNQVPRNFLRQALGAIRRLGHEIGDKPELEYDTYYDPMSRSTERRAKGYNNNRVKIEVHV